MTSAPTPAGTARWPFARIAVPSAAADVVAVLAFVAIGRAKHDEGSVLAGMASTAWPFLIGLVLGWIGLLLLRLGPLSYRSGVLATACTVVFGMLLRHGAQDKGTPMTFLLVAAGFLSLFLLAWRVLARYVRHRGVTRT